MALLPNSFVVRGLIPSLDYCLPGISVQVIPVGVIHTNPKHLAMLMDLLCVHGVL